MYVRVSLLKFALKIFLNRIYGKLQASAFTWNGEQARLWSYTRNENVSQELVCPFPIVVKFTE
jgi:hypothetical protein